MRQQLVFHNAPLVLNYMVIMLPKPVLQLARHIMESSDLQTLFQELVFLFVQFLKIYMETP